MANHDAFYADVPWDIPAGMEDYTVPTKYAPGTSALGYNPWCRQADCTTGFKTAQEIVRDFTQDAVAGATSQSGAAERIFYKVRDYIKLEDTRALGAHTAWKYRVGNPTMKASLMIAAARSAKIPARYVIREGTVTPNRLGYNADNSTSLADNAALDPEVFNNEHVYAEVWINEEWIAADPAWDSELAGVLDIARFGEALVSVKAKAGPNSGTRAAELPDEFIENQPHPYKLGENIDPATYDEAAENLTAPPQFGYQYWRDASSPLNQFLANHRYRATIRDMASVAEFGIAELQELRDISAPGMGNSDFILATNAMDQLKQALKDLGKGKTEDARAHFATAEGKIRDLSFFYDDASVFDNLAAMRLRYALALYTRQGGSEGMVIFHEANPPTIDVLPRIDNIGLNWQTTYGFDTTHWAYVTDPFTQIADYVPVTTPHPAGITLGCNDVMPAPPGKGDWHCDASLESYIFENLLIQLYGSFQPMKIGAVDDDNYTVAFNPKCTFIKRSYPGAPVMNCPDETNPAVLVDGRGRRYDPSVVSWDFDAPVFSDRGPFFNSIPVYSIAGSNGIPDFFEQTTSQYMRMIRMMGAYEFQRERGILDDMQICNRFIDQQPGAACMGVFAMDNQVAEDTIRIMADLGVQDLAFDPGNLAKATFTDQGYAWEVGRYIAASSNPGMNLRIVEAPTFDPAFVDGVVDALEAELAKPQYAGKRVVAGLLSHGFPTIDVVEQAFGFPGCSNQFLPGSPYLCPFVDFDPFSDPDLFYSYAVQFPTRYIYWEDQWHRNNYDFEDAVVSEVETRIAGGPTPLTLLDHNTDGQIENRIELPGAFGGGFGDGPSVIRPTTDGLMVIHNDFSEGDFDPSDRWIAGGEMFASGTAAGPSCTGGRCQNVFGTVIGLPAFVKEKIDADAQALIAGGATPADAQDQAGIDYFVDLPWLWGVQSSEDFHQKMTIFDAFRKGPMNMIWVDSDLRSEIEFRPSGVDEKPGMTPFFGARGFCNSQTGGADDPNLCWGSSAVTGEDYDPINFVHTPQSTEHEDFVRTATVDGFIACFADYANCGKEIQ
jgi:hypothetical protein